MRPSARRFSTSRICPPPSMTALATRQARMRPVWLIATRWPRRSKMGAARPRPRSALAQTPPRHQAERLDHDGLGHLRLAGEAVFKRDRHFDDVGAAAHRAPGALDLEPVASGAQVR